MDKYFYLAVFNLVLFTVLSFYKKNKLHFLLSQFLGFLLLFAVGFSFAIKIFVSKDIFKMFVPGLLSLTAIVMIIFVMKSGFSKIPKEELSLRPIFVVCLFLVSYILGIIAIHFLLPTFVGYLIGIVSLFCGIIIYRIQPKS